MQHQMMGPDIIEKMQDFFKHNPEQYNQMIKAQSKLQFEKQEQERLALDPKERLALAKNKLRTKRMTKHMHNIISKKEEEKDKKKDSEKEKAQIEIEEKQERQRIKREKKYQKKKDKKQKEQFENDFEIISEKA